MNKHITEIKPFKVKNWDNQEETLILFPDLAILGFGDGIVFTLLENGSFFLHSFIYQSDYNSKEVIYSRIEKDYSFVYALQDVELLEGQIKNGRIVLSSYNIFSQNYKQRSVFQSLVALGLGLEATGLLNVNLDFIGNDCNRLTYVSRVLERTKDGRIISKLSENVIVFSIKNSHLEPEDNFARTVFDFVAAIGTDKLTGSLNLYKEIYQDRDCIENKPIDYTRLWEMYFAHELIQDKAISESLHGKNGDSLIQNQWLSSLMEEQDHELLVMVRK